MNNIKLYEQSAHIRIISEIGAKTETSVLLFLFDLPETALKMSVVELANILKISRMTTIKALKNLEKWGYISVESGKGKAPNTYKINADKLSEIGIDTTKAINNNNISDNQKTNNYSYDDLKQYANNQGYSEKLTDNIIDRMQKQEEKNGIIANRKAYFDTSYKKAETNATEKEKKSLVNNSNVDKYKFVINDF